MSLLISFQRLGGVCHLSPGPLLDFQASLFIILIYKVCGCQSRIRTSVSGAKGPGPATRRTGNKFGTPVRYRTDLAGLKVRTSSSKGFRSMERHNGLKPLPRVWKTHMLSLNTNAANGPVSRDLNTDTMVHSQRH